MRVRLRLDRGGFVRGIETLAEPTPSVNARAAVMTGPILATAAEEKLAAPCVAYSARCHTDHDTISVRLAVLPVAAAILGSNIRAADPIAVCELAERLAVWAVQ